jgi:hypothetical protein
MRRETMTPDLVLDGVGYRLEQRTALEAWLLLRPYHGVAFPDLARIRARFAEAVPVRTLRPGTSHQLTCDWHMGGRRETPCHEA